LIAQFIRTDTKVCFVIRNLMLFSFIILVLCVLYNRYVISHVKFDQCPSVFIKTVQAY